MSRAIARRSPTIFVVSPEHSLLRDPPPCNAHLSGTTGLGRWKMCRIRPTVVPAMHAPFRALVVVVLAAGCVASAPRAPVIDPSFGLGTRGGVTLIRARCAKVQSCLLGHVIAADTAAPMAQAAVFL